MKRKQISLACFIAVCVIALAAVNYAYFAPLPEPAVFEIELPKNAELRPAEQVYPGTFRIAVSVAELLSIAEKSSSRPIVSYGLFPDKNGNKRIPGLHYWLERAGSSSVYYYAAALYSYKPWDDRFTTKGAEIQGTSLIVHPQREPVIFVLGNLLILVGGLVGVFIINRAEKRSEQSS